MMYLLVLLKLLLIGSAGNSRTEVRPQAVPLYRVHRTSEPIHIDGKLDEWDWVAADRLCFIKFRHEPEDEKPLREETRVCSLWDDQNLYLAFIVQDREIWATIRERDTRLFPEECVELYLDPDGDGQKYVEAQFNSLNNMRDLLVLGTVKSPNYAQFDEMARWNFRDLKKAIKTYQDKSGRDAGWTLEIAIPWSELGFSRQSWPPRLGGELRINFYRYERSRKDELPLELSGWCSVPDDWHDPVHFGRFVFVSTPNGSVN